MGGQSESATAALAAFGSRIRFDDIPADVVDKAKLCLLDTAGCCIHGSTLPFVKALIEMVLEEGGAATAPILGTQHRTSASQAALVNGTAAHAFQLDEVHIGATLHPGSAVVPAVLALSERARISGRDLLTAMIAGYEVGIRVGLAADGGMFRRGYHNQGTTGTLAAAAAAARALGLDRIATSHALGIAASQSAGLMAVQEGANAKAFHSGRAAQSGVYAARLAQRGFTGVEDVLDLAYGGFFSTLSGECKGERLTAELGRQWETRSVGYKLSPASNGSITAMQTLARIMARHRLTAADIDRIVAQVSTNTYHHCGFAFDPRHASVLGAQMSVRYGLSVMALDGAATAAQFTPERMRDGRLADFLSRIDLRICPEFDAGAGKLRLASRLEVRCTDGRIFTDETLHRKGSVEDPASAAEIEAKFFALAVPVIGASRAQACAARIHDLERDFGSGIMFHATPEII